MLGQIIESPELVESSFAWRHRSEQLHTDGACEACLKLFGVVWQSVFLKLLVLR